MSTTGPLTNEFSTVEDKVEIARGKKQVADAAFRSGNVQEALRSYHEALMYLQGLDKKGLPVAVGRPSTDEDKKTITEVDLLIETVHLNMAACHLKTDNYKRALYYADKVVAKNADSAKGQFRKAKALTGLGYTEKAIVILEALVAKDPGDLTFANELASVRQKEKAADAKSYKKFKCFLGKKPELVKADEPSAS